MAPMAYYSDKQIKKDTEKQTNKQVSLPSPSKIHLCPFLLRLATRLLEKLPDVASKLKVNLNLPNLVGKLGGDDEEDEDLCPTLYLVAALIERREEVEKNQPILYA